MNLAELGAPSARARLLLAETPKGRVADLQATGRLSRADYPPLGDKEGSIAQNARARVPGGAKSELTNRQLDRKHFGVRVSKFPEGGIASARGRQLEKPLQKSVDHEAAGSGRARLGRGPAPMVMCVRWYGTADALFK